MKKIHLFGYLIVLIGACFIGYGSFQLFSSHQKTEDALKQAKELIQLGQKNIVVSNKTREADTAHGTITIPTNQKVLGILYFPSLHKELPIIEGTDEDELERGVGHYSSTKLPDEGDQILLSGHRDTVFRSLGQLKIGDVLEVKMQYGSFLYQIDRTQIVKSTDTSIIHSTAPDEILTLSTCYPFHFVGNAPKRYIIYAKRLYEKTPEPQ